MRSEVWKHFLDRSRKCERESSKCFIWRNSRHCQHNVPAIARRDILGQLWSGEEKRAGSLRDENPASKSFKKATLASNNNTARKTSSRREIKRSTQWQEKCFASSFVTFLLNKAIDYIWFCNFLGFLRICNWSRGDKHFFILHLK